MKINIGIGLDNIIFGMSQEKVISVIGKPDKIVETEILQNIDYYFNNQLIRICFDKTEDYKLYQIEVFNSKAYMFNQKLINKEKSEILLLLKLNGYYKIEQEEYEFFETLFCNEIWSEFSFEFNRLKSITFSPLFDSNDKIIWPNEKPITNKSCSPSKNIQYMTPLKASSTGCFAENVKTMEIKIGIGLDNIVFGMFRKDIIYMLGKPDKISKTEKEDRIVYYYNKQMIKLKFDLLENGKLYSFEIYNKNAFLFNQEIINKEKGKMIALLEANGYFNFEYKDYEIFDTIFCNELWSTFAFKFDKLISIEFSPLSDKNNKIIWP